MQVKWLNERLSRNKTEILVESSKKNPVGGRKRRQKIKGKIKMLKTTAIFVRGLAEHKERNSLYQLLGEEKACLLAKLCINRKSKPDLKQKMKMVSVTSRNNCVDVMMLFPSFCVRQLKTRLASKPFFPANLSVNWCRRRYDLFSYDRWTQFVQD